MRRHAGCVVCALEPQNAIAIEPKFLQQPESVTKFGARPPGAAITGEADRSTLLSPSATPSLPPPTRHRMVQPTSATSGEYCSKKQKAYICFSS